MTTENKSIGEIVTTFMEASMLNDVDKVASKSVWVELMTNGEKYQNNDDKFKTLIVDNFSIDDYISIINYNPNIG